MIEDISPADLKRSEAWRLLDARLRPFVARRVGEMDVEDVLQDVYLRIQRGLPTLREEERLGPWAYRLARNSVVDHLRGKSRLPILSGEAFEPVSPMSDEGSEGVQQEVATYAVMFVAFLPSPYREALTLTEVEGVTQAHAADMLGVSLSTMKSRVQRGRRKLRASLEACCHIALDARKRVVGCELRADGTMPKGCCE